MARRKRAFVIPVLFSLIAILPGCRSEQKSSGGDIAIDSIPDTVRSAPRGLLFSPKDRAFSARLPYGFGEPVLTTARIVGGAAADRLTVYTAESGEHAVMLAVGRIPDDDGSSAERFNAARDAAIGSIGGTLVNEGEIVRDGHAGRSITLTVPTPAGGEALGRLDFYLVDGRIYELFYLSPTKQDFASADVAGFFESFRVQE